MTVAQRIYLHHLPHTQRSFIMKQIDFEHGKITDNILRASIPMLVAEVLSLLYNIVDRIYIARIPDVGTTALGAVGLCFPIITIILAFSNLFGSGGAPLFSIERGRKDTKESSMIMNTSFFLICVCALLLMAVGMIFAKPILLLFGSSENGLIYAYPYLMIYLLGTFPSMVSTGMNPFINAQGYATTGMFSVAIAAPRIPSPNTKIKTGSRIRLAIAPIATVLSQILSAAFVLYFLRKKTELKVRLLSGEEIRDCGRRAKNIISLGTAGFIMQLTNSLVTICCNNVLSVTGGDLYISVMTIVSSIRQIIDTPIHAITEGSSPVISYNYGARRPKRVFQSWLTMSVMAILYTLLAWGVILFAPRFLIGIFSSDQALITDAIPALKLYFGAFVFQALQYVGQTMFKSLGKKKFAIFFSLLRKVIIVVPLTYILPYLFHMGSDGVFLAEPVSNVLGGSTCFIVMLCTVMPELKRMAKENSDC